MYAGWTNYETWVVACHLVGTDAGKRLLERVLSEHNGSMSLRRALALAVYDYLMDLAPDIESPFVELLANAIRSVDFNQIADALMEV